MFSRILQKFGFYSGDDLLGEQLERIEEKNWYEKQIRELHKELDEKDAILKESCEMEEEGLKVIDPFVGDPSPVDTEKRKQYVATVAALHKDILEPKLKQMIALAYALLEESSNDRDYDQAIKGTVYALKEMIRWGNAMTNENMAFLSGDNPSNPDVIK